MNAGPYPMSNGLTRLQARFYGDAQRVAQSVRAHEGPFDARRGARSRAGHVRARRHRLGRRSAAWRSKARAALSPDALTGMEANLRFVGPETLETKIFGRLSAWQNWIFQRPNAVGPKGALTAYGSSERAEFDFGRT